MQVITLLFLFLTHHLYPHPNSTLELNEIFAEKGLLHFRTFGYGHSFGTLSHYVRPAHSSTPRQHLDNTRTTLALSQTPTVTLTVFPDP